jgi:polyhydroxyalkanoate synthesis regulator phasin
MENDNRMVELLADMLHEQKSLREGQERLEAGQERMVQAILSLTAMLQKTVIEPAAQQAQDIADLKRRVEALERSH